jgi:methanogenic corrinoid protein MtbC1
MNMHLPANQNKLISAVADLNGEEAINLVRQSLSENEDPFLLIANCQEGMRLVGQRYSEHTYYLSGLIMGGQIFADAMELIRPIVEIKISGNDSGKVLLGTVANDIHDLGKNIVNMLFTCHKFTVYDIGVDVPPQDFVKKAHEIQPDLIGLSGLITAAYDSMRDTIAQLRLNGIMTPVIIGGSQLDDEVCRYTGADYWVNDANQGLILGKQIIAKARAAQNIHTEQ